MGGDTWVGFLSEKSQFEIYVTALYFTFATMTTVGYGDVHPYSRNEKIFGIVAMVLACGVFAFTVGSMNSLLSKSALEESEHRARTIAVSRYMRKHRVLPNTQFRVRRYLEYLWDNQKKNFLKEREIVAMLSISLKDEIYSHVHGAILLSCGVFRTMETALIAKLSKLIDGETFAPGDVIFQEGEMSSKIYFVEYGKVDIFHSETKAKFATLVSGAYFGEISFFIETPRCAAANCTSFADLFSLCRSNLSSLSDQHPDSKAMLSLFATKCSAGDLTSLGVSCYLCGKVGHVACHCAKLQISFQYEGDSLKRVQRLRKLINPKAKHRPNMHRLHRPKLRVRYDVRNVIGNPSTTNELFANNCPFMKVVRDFEMNSGDFDSMVRQSTIRPQDCEKQEIENREKLHLSRFGSREEEKPNNQVAEIRRSSLFRKSLIPKIPLVVEKQLQVVAKAKIIPVAQRVTANKRKLDEGKRTKVTDLESKSSESDSDLSLGELNDVSKGDSTVATRLF